MTNVTNINIVDNTMHIISPDFNFSYTPADDVVKEEFKGQYRYFGGLQCAFEEGTEAYKGLEKELVEKAEKTLELWQIIH